MINVFDDDQEWSDDDFDECDDEPSKSYDLNFDECGFIPGEGCLLVGSEDCELDCPYRDAYYKELDSIAVKQESKQGLVDK